MHANEATLLEKASQQMHAGQFARALKSAKLGLKKFPKSAGFAQISGLAAVQLGQHTLAAQCFGKAVALAPAVPDFQENLVQSLIQANDAPQAVRIAKRLLDQSQKPGNLLYLLAMAQLHAHQPEQALDSINADCEHGTNLKRAYKLRAKINEDLGTYSAALADYEAAQPDDAPHSFAIEIANIHVRLRDVPTALQVMQDACAAAPDQLDFQSHLAVVAMIAGHRQTAIDGFQKVIAADPSQGSAFLSLAELLPENDLPAFAETVSAAAKTHGAQQPQLLLAQAKVEERLGNTAAEAALLATANKSLAKSRPYDKSQAQQHFAAATAGTVQGEAPQALPATPIFILGLPRSGTSLLERVLSKSPQVFSLGEYEGGDRISTTLDHAEGNLPDAAQLATIYARGLPDVDAGTTHITDKRPMNYQLIGPLFAAFPGARFINITRDPFDTALSTWRSYFAQSGLNYSFDQKAMAATFNLYQQYMAHWRDHTDAPILTVDYRDLVQDLDGTSRRLAQHCDLNWSAEMLRPDTAQDAIATASALQAREKVHTRSVGKSKVFHSHLKPFAAQLDPDLWSGFNLYQT